MRWLQRFFERLFGEHADDAVARLAVGRPSAEVERDQRLESLQTMVEERRKLRELEELDHQEALRKLTEQEKAAEVRVKEVAVVEKELDAQRKRAELTRQAREKHDKPRDAKPSEEEQLRQARLDRRKLVESFLAAGYSPEEAEAEARKHIEDVRGRYRSKGT